MEEIEARDELVFIKKVIEDSRRMIVYDGNDFIVWGILVAVGMIAMYVNIVFQYYLSPLLLWGILIGMGWVYSLIRGFVVHRRSHERTFAGKVISSVWLSCGIVMTLIGFALPALGVIKGWEIMPLIALVTGIAYYITSIVITEKWVRYSAYGWWIGALLIAAFPGKYIFLIYAGMMVCFQIVPGIVLQRHYKNQFVKQND
ncbi:MAG TPA: hypothetical protein DCQ28_09125 [Bacteroidetes bacterium]|nr:hypothetical protein [Bacteroidota bacterium]